MNPLSYIVQRWKELSLEERRRIGVGLGVLLVSLSILVAFRLTAQSLNGAAFEFMLGVFPRPTTKLISIGPENKGDVASLKNQVKRLSPQSADLRIAKRHLLRALTHLYEELEAEGEFAQMAQNRQYVKAETLSKKAEESRRLYLEELQKAKLYMERYSRETGKAAINIQFPE